MLADLNTIDIAHGKNVYANPENEDEQTFLFADSFERIAEGLYYVDFTFDWLGKELIKNEYPFSELDRVYWKRLNADYAEFGDEGVWENDGVKARREEYFAKQEEQHANFPSDYGVCDYPAQVVEKFPALISDPRRFLITFHKVRKSDQSEQQGWRWEKWGEYIGNQNSTADYLADEQEIEEVYTFSVLELVNFDAN